jgi:hypothetical protein
MPPKVDPSEVRFSTLLPTQSTLKSSVESQDLPPLSPLNWVLSVWYAAGYLERQEGRIRYREGRWKVEGYSRDGAAEMPEQSC